MTGAVAQGSNTLSESLAEYSALMVLGHTTGSDALRLDLRHDLDHQLKGRRSDVRGGQTLARVTRQGCVWYAKGSLVMYAIKDYIGEEPLIANLRAAVPDGQKAFVYAVTPKVTSSKLDAGARWRHRHRPQDSHAMVLRPVVFQHQHACPTHRVPAGQHRGDLVMLQWPSVEVVPLPSGSATRGGRNWALLNGVSKRFRRKSVSPKPGYPRTSRITVAAVSSFGSATRRRQSHGGFLGGCRLLNGTPGAKPIRRREALQFARLAVRAVRVPSNSPRTHADKRSWRRGARAP